MISKIENIAQWILYIWQLEDCVRVFSDDEQLDNNQQLSDIKRMMHIEGVMDKGHIQIAKLALNEMEEVHLQLLDEDAIYRANILSILPSLNILKSKSDNPEQSDIEMALVFLHSLMYLRLQKKIISDDTLAFEKQIIQILKTISLKYKTIKENNL